MHHPFWFFGGYRRLQLDARYAAELVNLCREQGFVYRNFSFFEELCVLECTDRTAKRLLSTCHLRGIPLRVSSAHGVPALLYRHRHRVGILVGAILFCVTVFFSGRVVWSIRVDGNRALSDEQVITALRECGMTVGDPLHSLDTGVIENRLLIASDEISWVSINMNGTVAHVEIREVQTVPQNENYAAANLVADRDGTVEWMEDVRGNVAVKIGDRVGEGELLVGGLYDIPGGGIRYTAAHGRVFARTERTFEVTIPLEYGKKIYTGEEKIEKSLIFFEKEVKFFRNCGNCTSTCDTIDMVEYFELPSGVRLPFGIRTVRHRTYELRQVSRSAESAMELAYYQLRCRMEGEIPNGMLMKKSLLTELTDEAYILRCRAQYVEDIAKVQEIEIEGIP